MIDSFYLAWRYIVYNRVKSLTMIASISLIAFLPIALQILLDESEQHLMARADSTTLLLGAKGNILDLVMNSLYFTDAKPEFINMKAAEDIMASNLALPIPLYVRFKMREYPVVGTSIDYFKFRKINVAQGRVFATLGECVIGADVATRYGLKVGDKVLTSPENLFDLSGVYPLKMTVVGILEKNYAADNEAVFVDLKTAWIIQGLGHGHQDIKEITDSEIVLEKDKNAITASAKLKHFNEITGKNLDSFHFHGDPTIYPVTAMIVKPHNKKSGTILMGRYLTNDSREQLIKPKVVIAELLNTIFKIKSFVDAVVLIVGLATAMAIVLIIALSLKLRQREMNTIFHLGCSRLTVVRLIVAELLIIACFSSVLCYISLIFLQQYESKIVNLLFIT